MFPDEKSRGFMMVPGAESNLKKRLLERAKDKQNSIITVDTVRCRGKNTKKVINTAETRAGEDYVHYVPSYMNLVGRLGNAIVAYTLHFVLVVRHEDGTRSRAIFAHKLAAT